MRVTGLDGPTVRVLNPAGVLDEARDATDAEFERITGRSFIPRVAQYGTYGTGP